MEKEDHIRLYTNGPRNFVLDPFVKLFASASEVFLAAPFLTRADDIAEQAKAGKRIRLIVGLNPVTDPVALKKLAGTPGITIRYFTTRFHAKVFIFDDTAIVGSANLTDAGMMQNREAAVAFGPANAPLLDDLMAFYMELWESASVLTDRVLADFARVHAASRVAISEAEKAIEDVIGRAEPANVRVESRQPSAERVFLEYLRRLVFEQYGPSFREIGSVLDEEDLHRNDLEELSTAATINRFLNWVRLEHATGDRWREVAYLDSAGRRARVSQFGQQWKSAENHHVDPYFIQWFRNVHDTFGNRRLLFGAGREEITASLLSLHAFSEQLRFTKGGLAGLGLAFWQANGDDLERVRQTLDHLLFGEGDFIERLHDVLYAPQWKLKKFGRFSALELFGTIHPDECPPMNGRMAKAIRFLGYDVPE